MPGRISASAVLALIGVLALRTADASQTADRPTRFSVAVSGQGPDVVLIPGLATPGDGVGCHGQAARAEPSRSRRAGRRVRGSRRRNQQGRWRHAPGARRRDGAIRRGTRAAGVIGHSLGGLIALEVAARTLMRSVECWSSTRCRSTRSP